MRNIEKLAMLDIAENKKAERIDKVMNKLYTLKEYTKTIKALEAEKADFCKKARVESIDLEIADITKAMEKLREQIEVIENNAERDSAMLSELE